MSKPEVIRPHYPVTISTSVYWTVSMISGEDVHFSMNGYQHKDRNKTFSVDDLSALPLNMKQKALGLLQQMVTELQEQVYGEQQRELRGPY